MSRKPDPFREKGGWPQWGGPREGTGRGLVSFSLVRIDRRGGMRLVVRLDRTGPCGNARWEVLGSKQVGRQAGR